MDGRGTFERRHGAARRDPRTLSRRSRADVAGPSTPNGSVALGGRRPAHGGYHHAVPLSVDRATARRFLVRRHLLAPPRSLPAEPASVRQVFERLGSLQFDPLDVTGRNHDLALAARIADYRRAWTEEALYGPDRWLYETYNKMFSLVPIAHLPWYRIAWDLHTHGDGTFQTHAELVDELLGRIDRDGPLSPTDVPARASIDWYWRPTNQVRAILEALAEAGVLGIARREGNRRVYDRVERLFPADLLAERPDPEAQRRFKLRSRIQAHGLLPRRGGAYELWYGTGPKPADRYRRTEELIDGGELVPVTVEDIRGERLVLGSEVADLEAAAASIAAGEPDAGGIAFLAPLDPLVWDRDLLRTLFDFDYVWEVYVPAPKRRWGYYVLPILHGDRLVGRIEPRIERKSGTLTVVDLWWEAGFDPLAEGAFADDLTDALIAHARWLGADRLAWPRVVRHRELGRRVAARLGPRWRMPPTATPEAGDRAAVRS